MAATQNFPNPYAEAFRDPQGPGDARPTAYQILKDEKLIGKLVDKTVLVTGGSDGLGLETVRQLAKTGAHVFFTARNEVKAEKVIQSLKEEAESDQELKGAKIDWIKMDNSSLKSVRAGAEAFKAKSKQLNILIENAGISNTPPKVTEDGFEEEFAVNYLAHFMLFHQLKPLLLASATDSFHSRVVVLSSAAHAWSTVQIGNYNLDKKLEHYWDSSMAFDGGVNPFVAYGQSKTADIWLADEIERQYGSQRLHGLSVDPGAVATNIQSGVDERALAMLMPMFQSEMMQKIMKSARQGAATQVLAAVGHAYEGKGGVYLADCGVPPVVPSDTPLLVPGCRAHGHDAQGAQRLWLDSRDFVGMTPEC